MFRATGLGRGHVWLNGHDLGRFWNITRADNADEPSQQHHHLPRDWLVADALNNLTVFDALGGDPTQVTLVTSRFVKTTEPVLVDEIDSPTMCLS